ncbi:DUF2537 domain-containing protein [Prauserella cavernicola]|uniref:DUF2537 domain-containing protein n=1 Tax=Prauserella cavernicola TaxID=2800127 RepID=A0A934QU46_9PSEU|nr:DUF2537 domain-containing protein [Prauserella cavernicola]MBK1785408.1 DUF2537 domain-containing protein [Prauserella cavernicola]
MAGAEVELRLCGERAVLAASENGQEADPRSLALDSELADALHEWARVAAALRRTDSGEGADVVARRGRQLAGRVAESLGLSVSFWDPATERTLVVTPPPRPQSSQGPPSASRATRLMGSRPSVDERTPWATGLIVALFMAVFVIVAMLALVNTLATETSAWVAVAAAVVVSAGLAPSLWLARRLPILRWVVLGVAAGVVLSWIGVLVVVL